jgi:hypothetical protein
MAAPIVFLRIDDAEVFLGEALLSALAASRSGARDPGESIKRQLLVAARSKSWTTFMRGTAVVDVEKDEAGIRLFLARTATRRPFVTTAAPTTTLGPRAPAIEVGCSVKSAFRSLEPKRRPKKSTPA